MKQSVCIGIDMGGTNTAFGFVTKDGNVVAEGNISTTGHHNTDEYIKRLTLAIKEQWGSINQEYQITAIGVGAPSGNYRTRSIEESANLPWQGVIPFCDILEEIFGIPTFITNDANAATLGEQIYGGAKGMQDFVMVTLGTGLGSGYVANGRLIYGHNGLAGELGHTTAIKDGRECGCGKKGCLETYCSATGVKRTAIELMATTNTKSELRDIPYNKLTSKDVAIAANNGDKLAQQVFQITGEILGEALANTVAITGPEAIFLMGGLTKAGDLLFNPLRKSFNKSVMFLFKDCVNILPSAIDGNVAILGAAALAWSEIKESNNG